jgi:hypothetical protein
MEVARAPAAIDPRILSPASTDAVAQKLQILTTEHLSLLTARSLTWNESFGRVSIFLSVLTGSVISLALIAQAAHFGPMFVEAAAIILSVDLVVGVVTIARLLAINEEDVRWTAGINRLRHAYLQLHPDLAPYFITGSTDDQPGLAASLGWNVIPRGMAGQLMHGSTSLPGAVGVLVSVVAAAVAGLVAIAAQLNLISVVAVASLALVLTGWALTIYARRAFEHYMAAIPVAFPTPGLSPTPVSLSRASTDEC